MAAKNTTTNNPNDPSPTVDVSSPYTPRRPAPIVSISVNHPFATAARKIKNFLLHKQTLFSTTFNIKVTPIVALVSFFGVAAIFGGGITTAFNFGKTVESNLLASVAAKAPSPTPKIIIQQPAVITLSKAGVIKATYQYLPSPEVLNTQSTGVSQAPSTGTSDPQATGDSATPPSTPIPPFTPTPTPQPVLHYILLSSGQSITFLTAAASVHIANYVNRRVLITGSYDTTKNTLFIEKAGDIEVLQ